MVGHEEEKMAVQNQRAEAEHANCNLMVAVAVVSEP
jgi:hypothetical protein